MNDLIHDITSMSTELESLKQKSLADDNLIGVLKDRIKALVTDNEKTRHAHANEASRLLNERNTALQMVEEVQGIITAIGNHAMQGLKRMRPQPVVEKSTVVVADERIPTVLYPEQSTSQEEPLQLMRPAGGSSVDREVEEAIRPFIRRRDVSRDRIDDEFVLPASASHGPR